MKKIIFAFSLILTSASFAKPVDGEIFYELPNKTMAVRNVTLDVPSMGQGEVKLSGNNFEWSTKKFKSYNVRGEQKFIIKFNEQFQGTKFTQIFKGTYFKTSDHIKYYGSIYKKDGTNIKYIGGFEFNFQR